MLKIVLFVFVAMGTAHCWLGGDKKPYPDWDNLAVTFRKFSTLPKSVTDAVSEGWTKMGDGCASTQFFLGQQFALNGDLSTILLFDRLGQVAGIQFSGPSTMEVAKNRRNGPFVESNGRLYLTAYFTDLANICSEEKVRNTKTVGDKLLIQTSAKRDLLEIPLKEADVEAKTAFVKGNCFYGMGQHYWHNISNHMDCEDFYPVFLLYNGGDLNAFGWATAGFIDNPRVEHPPNSEFGLGFFFPKDKFPRCLLDPSQVKRRLTTQHIYLQRRPYLNLC